MIRCIVVDDEPLALRQMAEYVRQIPFLDLVGQCQSALDVQRLVQEVAVDAMFLDISMPDMNGMDLVRSLPSPVLVVFTTAFSEYAVEGYKVNAVDYLLKPFGLDDFKKAAEKVKRQYDLEHKCSLKCCQKSPDDSIFFKTEHRVVRVALKQICYIESMSEYLKIYIEGQKPLVVLMSMKKIEESLPANFMRVHRSYIINLHKIQEVSKNRVVMSGGMPLPIGDNYKDMFAKYVNDKFIGR